MYASGQVARAGRLTQVVVQCGGVLMHCGCSIAAFQCLEGMDWACKACLLFMGQLKFVFLFQANLGMGQRNPKDFLSSFSLCALRLRNFL